MSQHTTRRSWFRVTWIRLFLCMALLSACALLYWQSASLESQLQTLREQGLPTNGSELNDYYRVPPGESDTTELWIRAVDAADAVQKLDASRQLPIIGHDPTPIPPVGTPWEQLDQCRSFLASVEDEMQLIRAACEAGGCVRFPIDFEAGLSTDPTRTQNCRTIARLLSLDAHVSVHDGDHQRALKDLLGILATSQAIQAEPANLSQLIRSAVYSIAANALEDMMPSSQWSDADLLSLQQAFVEPDFRQSIRTGLIGERAIHLLELKRNTPTILYRTNAEMVLEIFSLSLESLSGDWSAALAAQQDISAEMTARMTSSIGRFKYWTASVLLPGQEHFVTAAVQATARQRCIICAIAVERFRRIHGTDPAALTDIDANLFPSPAGHATCLIDPFNDQPLKFLVANDGVTVYSVNSDLQDDGGSFNIGLLSGKTDLGVRLSRGVVAEAPIESP